MQITVGHLDLSLTRVEQTETECFQGVEFERFQDGGVSVSAAPTGVLYGLCFAFQKGLWWRSSTVVSCFFFSDNKRHGSISALNSRL